MEKQRKKKPSDINSYSIPFFLSFLKKNERKEGGRVTINRAITLSIPHPLS